VAILLNLVKYYYPCRNQSCRVSDVN